MIDLSVHRVESVTAKMWELGEKGHEHYLLTLCVEVEGGIWNEINLFGVNKYSLAIRVEEGVKNG